MFVEIGMAQHLVQSERREGSEISNWVLLRQQFFKAEICVINLAVFRQIFEVILGCCEISSLITLKEIILLVVRIIVCCIKNRCNVWNKEGNGRFVLRELTED